MKYKLYLLLLFFGLTSFAPNLSKAPYSKALDLRSFTLKFEMLYNALDANNFKLPSLKSFSNGIQGYENLKQKGIIENNFLTIIDYSISSTSERLWVINMTENKIIFHTLVAHGKKSGEVYANSFSNTFNSNKSSLGFFTTGETYIGQHGLSLKLDGLERGINDKVRQRAIVIHGADYVSENFINKHGCLGRSQGCPALPNGLSKKIIQTIKNKSCLFIYFPSVDYEKNCKLIS
jgi:hypothetical protein